MPGILSSQKEGLDSSISSNKSSQRAAKVRQKLVFSNTALLVDEITSPSSGPKTRSGSQHSQTSLGRSAEAGSTKQATVVGDEDMRGIVSAEIGLEHYMQREGKKGVHGASSANKRGAGIASTDIVSEDKGLRNVMTTGNGGGGCGLKQTVPKNSVVGNMMSQPSAGSVLAGPAHVQASEMQSRDDQMSMAKVKSSRPSDQEKRYVDVLRQDSIAPSFGLKSESSANRAEVQGHDGIRYNKTKVQQAQEKSLADAHRYLDTLAFSGMSNSDFSLKIS